MTRALQTATRARAASTRPQRGAAVVLGARNLGRAITRGLLADECAVASIARTPGELETLRADGALPLAADASEPEQLEQALREATSAIGPIGLVVNAVSAVRPPRDGSAFGGGALAEATDAAFEGWVTPAIRQSFVFLREGARLLSENGGTLIEIVGSPGRRADPGRGLVAAAQAAVRAMTHAAAQELRGNGIHVALLIVDGIIESPKTAQMTSGMPREALIDADAVVDAVRQLAEQSSRGWSHELVLTPAGSRWTP